ncbi:hypothetical protein FPV67DRAFT_1662683 [Lyophyllum atratum]|nr:hypothetical protein FPV67DRAFT_1662683 [Lyophyllum atratum]
MDSLASIWDEPVEQPVAEDTPKDFSSRPKDPLFFAGSDDEDVPRPPPQNVPDVDFDIDALFADVENDDDPFSFKPLTSKLDTEALRREAEARYKKNMPSLTPHAIMSSSPPRDMGDEDGSKSKTAGEKGKESRKEGGSPLPTLNRLLQIYGYWTHGMYPKTTFRDTVERVEKLCHSKRMHVSLSVWRDEAHGLVNGRKPHDDDDDEIIDLTENPGGDPTTSKNESSRASSPVSDGAADASSSSHPPSHPPSSGAEMDDDDDFDIDAVIRDEEARVAKERAASQASDTLTNFTTNRDKGKGRLDDDDDTAMWEALDAMQDNVSHAAQFASTVPRMDEDETMWDELDALQDGALSVTAPVKPSSGDLDEDEDMWDVVRELEADATGVHDPRPPTTTTEMSEVTAAVSTTQQDDDDWDSVYV